MDSKIDITNCEFFENNVKDIFQFRSAEKFTVTDSNFYDNSGRILLCEEPGSSVKITNTRVGTFSNCTFNNNVKKLKIDAFCFDEKSEITFDSCDLGDSTFENKQYATFTNCTGDGIGSLFGAGSAPMLIVMGALIAVFAGASVVVMKKRRAAEAK